jgi:murein DD-endopeptidase MepM/ murein hydrolase activator NlpD
MPADYSRRTLLKATGGSIGGAVGAVAMSGTAAAHSKGTPVYTTTTLNIRDGVGLENDVKEEADKYTGMEVVSGPWNEDGYTWWGFKVNGDDDHHDRYTGYAVQKYTAHADFAYPTTGQVISTYWDSRGSRYHRGIDIDGDRGQTIRAAADGTIRQTNKIDTLGRYIEIDHAAGYITRYGHLSDIDVNEGDSVSQDQHIGNMGSSGDTTVVHLHFVIMRGGDDHGDKLNWPMDQGAHVYSRTGIEKNFPDI